jgi:site-specific DNA recombinase
MSASPGSATPVAVYLRVSTDEQRERQSIENQRDFAERYRALHALAVYDVYADDGVSGIIPLAGRPDGARLLRDAADGRFGAVLVYRIDRFGRSVRVLLSGAEDLERHGVALRSMTEPFDTRSPIGRFVLTLLASLAELERETIRERSMLGRQRSVREGRWPGGPAPLGYRLLDGRLAIDPEEAALVRRIFELYARGLGLIEIGDRLTAERVPTYAARRRTWSTSGRWAAGRLSAILSNELYVGRWTYGKTCRSLDAGGRPIRGKAPEAGRTTRPVPPIVEPDLFEAARPGSPARASRRPATRARTSCAAWSAAAAAGGRSSGRGRGARATTRAPATTGSAAA